MDQQIGTAQENARLLSLAALASVVTAALLIAVKIVAWVLTGSVGMLASLVDSVLDLLVSSINMLAIRYALKPADAEHRFGHGKIESIAGLAQAAFVAGSACFLILHAIDRLRFPQPLADVTAGIGVLAFSIVMTGVLLSVQGYVIRRTGSTAIRADALHYRSDVLTNLGIIVALILVQYGWTWTDPVIAMAISVYIITTAIQIAGDSLRQLTDSELEPGLRNRILSSAHNHSEVLGIHDMRTRQAGQTRFVQLHLDLDQRLPLSRAHEIADEVEARIREILPGAEIIIHQDPVTKADKSKLG